MEETNSNEHEFMLTTIDNPFNPFTQFDEWLVWDHNAGYDTPALLDRIVIQSDEMSEADQAQAIDLAIEEIVRENVSGMHTKVFASTDNQADTT